MLEGRGMKAARRRLRWWCAACALLAAGRAASASAQDYLRDEEPAPASAEELSGPIVVAFPEAPPTRTPLFPQVKQALEHYPAFVSDAQLDVNVRTYYFLRDIDKDSAAAVGIPDKSEAWAGGGSIAAQSGWLWDRVALGGEFFTSLPLYAPESRPGTGLLKPIQDPVAVFGQGYLRLRHKRQVVTLYRQRYDLPYLNINDSRMVPNTFEGYSIDGHWPYGRFVAGYVDRIKLRGSDRFVPMSRAVGVLGKDRGLAMLGMRYDRGDGFFVGAIASVVPDVLSTVYSELDSIWTIGEWGLRVGAQFTDQRSLGGDLLTGSSFNTQSGGMRLAASFRHAILTTAFNVTADGARVRNPYGGSPSFTSLMLSNFTLANQKTFQVGLSYDWGRIGVTGLSGFVNYAYGLDPENATTGAALRDNQEIDMTMDFRPDRSPLRGAWLRVRTAVLNPGSNRQIYNVRVTFNWALPLI